MSPSVNFHLCPPTRVRRECSVSGLGRSTQTPRSECRGLRTSLPGGGVEGHFEWAYPRRSVGSKGGRTRLGDRLRADCEGRGPDLESHTRGWCGVGTILRKQVLPSSLTLGVRSDPEPPPEGQGSVRSSLLLLGTRRTSDPTICVSGTGPPGSDHDPRVGTGLLWGCQD